MAKFAYTVCPNIIKRFSFNSLQHTESYDFPIAAILGIGHFEDCHKMLYFIFVMKLVMCHQDHALKVLKEVHQL